MTRLDLQRLIDRKYHGVLTSIQQEMRELTSSRLSGDDSPYTDPWLEYVAQVQGQHSFAFAQYEGVLQQFCDQHAKGLTDLEVQVLWYGTEGYWEWTEQGLPDIPLQREHVAEELFRRLEKEAMDEDLLT